MSARFFGWKRKWIKENEKTRIKRKRNGEAEKSKKSTLKKRIIVQEIRNRRRKVRSSKKAQYHSVHVSQR